jgi:hypothetical protein
VPETTAPVPFPTFEQPMHESVDGEKYDLGSAHSQIFDVGLKTKVFEHVHAGVAEFVSTAPVLLNPLKTVQTKHFPSIIIEFPGHWHVA